MGSKRDSIGAGSSCWPVELHRQISFNKVGLKEMALIFELPTLVYQRNKSHLCGIYIEGCSYTDCHTVSYTPNHARINREINRTWVVGNVRNHLKIKCHRTFSFERDPDREADCEAVKNGCRLTVSMSDPWDYKAHVSTHRYAVLSCSHGYRGYEQEQDG